MKNIITQDGCWNCKHGFCFSQQDEPDFWYCNVTDDRPKCGWCNWKDHIECHLHDRNGKNLSNKEITERMDVWSEWIRGKEIQPWQKCDYYGKD